MPLPKRNVFRYESVPVKEGTKPHTHVLVPRSFPSWRPRPLLPARSGRRCNQTTFLLAVLAVLTVDSPPLCKMKTPK